MNEPRSPLDPRAFYMGRIDSLRPEFEWSARTRVEAEAWQRRARAAVRGCAGLPRETPPALEPRTVESVDFPEYRREAILFRSRAGLDAFGYFLTPRVMEGPAPAVVCLPGHGRGVDSIVGIAEDGLQRSIDAPAEYQADFALQCVGRGFIALALEQISFGRRRDEKATRAGGGASSCSRDAPAALMLGETITGWRVWDAMRAIDYLRTRPEVDPDGIATMGISGGGLTSLWTAALDDRVGAAVVSGYFNTFRDSILSIDHCVDNYVPGISRILEMPDFSGLIAPRGLFVESGRRDDIFPIAATERAVERASAIYGTFGVPGRFGSELFDAGHQFHGVGAFAFLDEQFSRPGPRR